MTADRGHSDVAIEKAGSSDGHCRCSRVSRKRAGAVVDRSNIHAGGGVSCDGNRRIDGRRNISTGDRGRARLAFASVRVGQSVKFRTTAMTPAGLVGNGDPYAQTIQALKTIEGALVQAVHQWRTSFEHASICEHRSMAEAGGPWRNLWFDQTGHDHGGGETVDRSDMLLKSSRCNHG